jgi:hypothetical protein
MTEFSGPLDPTPRRVPHTLTLFSPLQQGAKYVETLNDRLTFYQRSFRWHGGCWQAVLEIRDEKDSPRRFDAEYAHEWAQNRLAYHLEERLGRRPFWSGMIDEVELSVGGWGERISLLPVANMVRAVYVDADGETQRTSWVQDTVSQAKYGIRQKEVVLEREEAGSAEATAFAEASLQEMANPVAEPIAVSAGQTDQLVVRASGYVFTANSRYVSVGAGDYDVSDFIIAVVNTDLDYITPGYIQTNTMLTAIGSTEVTPVWEGIRGVIMIRGDMSTMPHRVWVDADRRLHYFKPSPTPRYRWHNRQVYTAAGAGAPVNPWEVTPGIIRNPMARRVSPPFGSYLVDGRDRIIWEVTMSTRQEQPIFTWAGSTEAELKKAYEIRRGQEIHSL